MAVDIQKLFNEELPAALAKDPSKAKEVGGKYQLNVTGDGGGEWFIDLSDAGPKAVAGTAEGSDVTITLASEDFQKYYENPQTNGMQLFFAGKLKVVGNQMLAMKLQKLIDFTKS